MGRHDELENRVSDVAYRLERLSDVTEELRGLRLELRLLRLLLKRRLPKPGRPVRLSPSIRIIPKEGTMALPAVSFDLQHDALIVNAPTDAAGNPVPDSISYSVSDPTVFSLSPSADTLECRAVSLKEGTATVSWADGFGNSESVELTVAQVVPGAPVALNARVTIVSK